jgi:spermidine synthase
LLLTFCLLTVEVALTRLFSVTIWYHFAFLAISVALFGAGAAALLVHLIQRRLPVERTPLILTWCAALLGAVIIGSTLVLLGSTPDLSSGVELDLLSGVTGELLVTFVAAAAPFFVGGFAIALAMTRYSGQIHTLYAWDLLGAGLGCLAVIPALGLLGATQTLAATGVLAALAGVLFAVGGRGDEARLPPWVPGLIGAALAGLIAIGSSAGWLDVRTAKGLNLANLDIEYNEWNSFSLVTVLPRHRFKGWGMSPVFDGDPPERKTLVIDMNAMTPLIRFDGDLERAEHVMYDLSAMAHQVRPWAPPERVLVIGAGGGRDVLAALVAGARHVTAVEINPLIVEDVMGDRYAEFTGRLYARDDVTAVVDDGRSFVKRQPAGELDLIHLSMVDTSAATAAGAYSLTENSLHTLEAFDDYLDRLAPNGMLSISSVSMPGLAAGAGLAAMAWQTLRDRGIDPARSVAVVSAGWIERPGSTMHTVIVKPQQFTERELASIARAAERLRFKISHLPGAEPPPGSFIGRLLRTEDRAAFERLLRSAPLDVTPATDDRPFFFYQNRFSDIGELLAAGKPAYLFGNGLFILAKVALIALVLVAVFLVAPFVLARKELSRGRGSPVWDLAYVACLGLGFMFVEIGSIQKLTLYLGRPTHTLAVVLLTLLVAGAAGSRLFAALGGGKKRLLIAIGALVLLLTALWIAGLGDLLLGATAAWSSTARALIASLLLAPAGLLLGMPFPAGLAAIASRAQSRIPWLWCINSATSVLGSVLAVLLAMHLGVPVVLGLGAAIYLLALVLSLKVAGRTVP